MVIVKRKQSAPGLYHHGSPGSSTRISAAGLYTETALDGKSVTLHWSAPAVSYNQSTALYQIYKANSFIATVPATQYYYVDTNVAPGVSYEYSVFLIYNPA